MNELKDFETKQYRAIFPGTLNDHDTLFGGIAMQWMDEVAYITALRFLRHKIVTVSTDNFKFIKPVKSGEIVEITGNICNVSQLKTGIKVEVFSEDMYSGKREKAIEAVFYFAAVDDNNRPIRINHGI